MPLCLKYQPRLLENCLKFKMTLNSRSLCPKHGGPKCVLVSLCTLAALLLLAKLAFATCDLEAGHNTLTRLDSLDLRADGFHDAAELMTQDIAFLQLHYTSVQQMQIGAAHCGASNAQNDIPGFDDARFGDFFCSECQLWACPGRIRLGSVCGVDWCLCPK